MLDPHRGRAQPAAAGRRRACRAPTATTRPSTTPTSTPRGPDGRRAAAAPPRRDRGARLHGPPPGHDPRVARQRPARRSDGEALPRRSARAGHGAAAAGARAAPGARSPSRGPSRRRAAAGPARARAIRRFRSPHTRFAARAVPLERQLHRGRDERRRAAPASAAGRAVTRHREDPTRDPGSQFLYLRDVRSGAVWSATFQPTAQGAGRLPWSPSSPRRRPSSRRDDDIATQLDIAVSTEDDVEVRRLAVTNHSDRPREIEITSYAEIVLAPPADDLAHPAFGKLFVETEYLPGERRAPLPPPAARRRTSRRSWAVHVLSLEGRTQGPVEWETRPRALPGPRARPRRSPGPRRALALRHHRASCSTPSSACGSASAWPRAASCGCPSPRAWPPSRETALALAQRYHEPSVGGPHLRPRLRPRPERPPPPRHLQRGRRCSSSAWPRACSTPTARSAREPELLARNTLGQEGLWPHGSRATCRSCWCAWSRRTTCRSCARSSRRRSTGGSRGCSADVVILNEHPVSYLDEMHAAAHGAPRQRALADVEAPARGRLPAARRPHGRGRAHPARDAWRAPS